MWKWLGKSALSSAGVLIMFGAQIGPDDAELNLCKWARLALPDTPQHCLAGVNSLQIEAFGAVLLVAGIAWFIRDFIVKRRPRDLAQGKLGPNWPIRDLFLHIDPSITKNPYRDPETEVARNILDYLATGRLHSWGRFTGSNGALVPIPEDFWKEAEWVMMFFDPDDAEQIHARYPASNKGYRDVQFNKAEALAIWPKSITTIWPDFAKWDKIDPLEAYQAACLWADEEPRLPWPSWGAEKVYRKLNDAALAHDLIVVSGDTTRKATLDAIETVTSKVINPHGEVWREDMRKLAEKWGEKPKFLYPRSRV
ncbi:hypothetical protein BPNPMPFG_004512 [Mesorhizobium sp. AR07]|uniref:hypothetical protein n=1 Tax=Mesorhizobium sp. AR07 TaxID=2865838 RepID=UPI0021604EEB|nr:hypothetical protein [Mesorhizobium sp. AR07]UVK42794.1 hypothetical protein BPNPMPFG_004512 [Mesorhizobium sp. AR07]